MKKTEKALILLLCGALCAVLLACASGGGGGGGQAADGFGEGVPLTGEWITYTDIENKGDSKVKMEVVEMEGMTAHKFTGNTTNKYEYGFVGWLIEPDAASLELLKKARAISFKFVGDGKRQTVKYRLSTVRDHAHHEHHFGAEAGEVTRVEVPVKMFMQPGWGAYVAMKGDNVVDVAWQTHESWRPASFEITIWDVRVHP